MITVLLGQKIKELRIKTGDSQEKFALKINMDRTYYASVESGKRNISIINKAKSTTFSIYLFLSCMAVTILALLGIHDIAQYIAYSVLLFVVIYWSCYWIYQKKM